MALFQCWVPEACAEPTESSVPSMKSAEQKGLDLPSRKWMWAQVDPADMVDTTGLNSRLGFAIN